MRKPALPRRAALLVSAMLSLSLAATPARAETAPKPSAAPKPSPLAKPSAASSAWMNKVVITPLGGHLLGNPEAETKLVEYMSYTCPHCAHFEEESALPLRMGYVATGRVSFEVRNLLRDPVDATVALLTHCVTPNRFFALHRKFLVEQPKWLAVAQGLNPEQTKRWGNGPMPLRLRAIAGDLHFYDMVAGTGLTRSQADACLANEPLLRKIAAQSQEAQTIGVNSTPSFVINGELLKDEHDWHALQPKLTPPAK